jgi:succinoglycan biosynthesis protein ExoA
MAPVMLEGPPGVTVVMPVRNEERHLAAAVTGVLEQHYQGELEVILAVGPSSDRTAEIAWQLAAADSRVRVVDNRAGRTPHALNLAIAEAKHDIIVRVDGHGELTPGYISRAVELLLNTGAANVGGMMAAQGETAFEEAVAVAYTTPLGLGGSTFHLESSPPGPADTVYLGVFRRDALEAVGGFDETMHRAQDWELNYRLRRRGETIWFSPELKVTYRPRSTFPSLMKQFFETGKWRREVMRRHPETANLRYLVPPVVVGVIGLGSLAAVVGALTGRKWLMAGLSAPAGYGAAMITGTAMIRTPMSPEARRLLPLVFAAMHMSWGVGFLVGVRDRAT